MYLLRFLEKALNQNSEPVADAVGVEYDSLAAVNCTIAKCRPLLGERAMRRAYYSEHLSNCSWPVNRSRRIPRNYALD
jgi:hypothetical protein